MSNMNDETIQLGDVVCSKNGRFKGELFVVLSLDGNYAYVANGKSRKSDSPKKKKLKHLHLNVGHSAHIANKIAQGDKVTNTELRIAIEEFI
jgi:ribosomal protein L14E/L6E/L27E